MTPAPKIQALGIVQDGSPTRWQARGYVEGVGWLEAWGRSLIEAMEARLPPGGVHSDAPVQSHAPVQEYAPVPTYALPGLEPPKLSTEDRKSERWNLYMPRWIRRRIERAAVLEGLSPSQFVQRLCAPWAATWHEPEAGSE